MKKNLISIAVSVVAAAVLGVGIYYWCFCRFYDPPDHMAIVSAKSGKNPAAGT